MAVRVVYCFKGPWVLECASPIEAVPPDGASIGPKEVKKTLFFLGVKQRYA